MRNSRKAGLLAAVFGLGLVSSGLPAYGETLAEAIALAYKTNPQVLVARSTMRNADEAYFRSTISLVDPTVTVATVGVSLADTQELLHGGNDNGPSLNLSLSGIGVQQTLFNGGRIATGMDQARNTLMTQRENWRAAEMAMLSSVVRAYTGVRQAEGAYKVGQDSLTIQKKAADDAQARYDVGTQTISELKNTQATFAGQQAQVLTQQNSLQQARNVYLTAIGQLPGTLSQEPDISPFLPKSFEEAYRIAQQNSPTIRNAYLAERQAAIALANARAPYRPSATFNLSNSFGSRANFSDRPSSIGFDTTTGSVTATLGFNIPLWPGRATNSTLRSAEESYRSAQYTLDLARRTLYQNISQDWNNLENNRRQLEVQTIQVEARRVSQAGYQEQYTQGAANLTDKLNADQALASAEQTYLVAGFTLFNSGVTLLQDLGVLTAETFGVTGIDKFDPTEHFERINGRGSGMWAEWVEGIDRRFGVRAPEYVPQPGEVIPEFVRP